MRLSRSVVVRLAVGVVCGGVPLVQAVTARADPFPPPLPGPGYVETVVVQQPSTSTGIVPPPSGGCVVETSYNNPTTPLVSVFRGESACASNVYNPVISAQSWLVVDWNGAVAAYGNSTGGTGVGPWTSEGTDPSPVPGMEYTINYQTSITLVSPEFWGAPPSGCSVSGQTLNCLLQRVYQYIPGTQGGVRP